MLLIQLLFTACSGIAYSSDERAFSYVDEKYAVLINGGDYSNICAVCDTNLSEHYKTNHTATYEDVQYQYCSLHCFADHLR